MIISYVNLHNQLISDFKIFFEAFQCIVWPYAFGISNLFIAAVQVYWFHDRIKSKHSILKLITSTPQSQWWIMWFQHVFFFYLLHTKSMKTIFMTKYHILRKRARYTDLCNAYFICSLFYLEYKNPTARFILPWKVLAGKMNSSLSF